MTTHQRPALDVLAELRRGKFQAELTDAMHDVLQACIDTGKKGEVVVKISFDPAKVNDFETPKVGVTDQINTKRPRRTVMPSTFFLTDDGNPVRTDPNQEEFESMRAVPGGDTGDSPAIRKAN